MVHFGTFFVVPGEAQLNLIRSNPCHSWQIYRIDDGALMADDEWRSATTRRSTNGHYTLCTAGLNVTLGILNPADRFASVLCTCSNLIYTNVQRFQMGF